METLSSNTTSMEHFHHGPIKVPTSPAPMSLTMARQTVRVPRPSQSVVSGNLRLGSVPVTPDPNSASKIYPKTKNSNSKDRAGRSNPRLNKFVRRLHDMLIREKHSGIVEWRRGLLVLFSTDAFSKKILPKYFNTRNFKTFRRQLNYYGFVHVRSFSATGNTTTALWINQHLAEDEANDDISAVLKLRRVEPDEVAKTVEGRRLRKELAIHTVEEDIGLNSKALQMGQIRSMAVRGECAPSHRGQSYVSSAANAFLRPRSVSNGQEPSLQRDSDSEMPHVHSENSITSSTNSGSTNYCSSNEDDASADESPGSAPALPQLREDEVANSTDAAASVLLMLSRS